MKTNHRGTETQRKLNAWFCFLCVSAPLWLTLSLHAADWPQWLGPNRDGSTSEIVRPWKDPPKILWRKKVAEGHSSPIVGQFRNERHVILHAAANDSLSDSKDQQATTEYVTAFDPESGDVKWVGRMAKKKFQSQFGNGPRATPAIFDPPGQCFFGHISYVCCLGVTGTYAAFDCETGKLRSDAVDLVAEYQGKIPKFGVSAAPLVENGIVYVQIGGPEAGIVAIDARTGKLSHKYLKEPASYAAITAVGPEDRRQIVVLNSEAVYGLPPNGGEPFWRYKFRDLLSESSTTPIVADGKLIVSSVTLGAVALKLTEKDGKPSVEEAWKNPRLSCYFSTPVAVGKHLYVVTGKLLPPSADLHCVDLDTGKILWTHPKVGKYGATLIRTGDDKLLMLEEAGDLVLIQPDAGAYKELCHAKVCGHTWAHPALADGRLYVRDENELICVQFDK